MTFFRDLSRCATLLSACGLIVCTTAHAASSEARITLPNSTPRSVAQAQPLGRVAATDILTATLSLPLRREADLDDLLRRLSDPTDPDYGQYLTPAQFTAQFSPTAADYAAVAAYVRAQGLTITGTQENRLLLNVTGPSQKVEQAFGVHLNRYLAADGRIFHAADSAPSVPSALAGRIASVLGLSNAALRHPYAKRVAHAAGGTGPMGGLSPSDIKTAYSLSGVTLDGSGQTLAVFEFDGYTTSDIQTYESRFGLPHVPMRNILVDGATGQAGADSEEATLDIELQTAMAPGASKILVYETVNTETGTMDGYARIAQDNLAKQISTSWGLDEPDSSPSLLQSENTIFKQMAAQGQTIYAAAGDSGAYDSGSKRDGLSVDDPASQPYVCGVGGTTLTTNGAGGAYVRETTWNTGSVAGGAGGGGSSRIWPIPAWQQSVVTTASRGSTTMRNTPDVALNADPDTGYAIYSGGEWIVFGGCSCGSPLWAGFTALVNQQRAAQGLAPLGQAAPAFYALRAGPSYAKAFHDIADSSTNLYYPAVTGYDDATGLGSMIGQGLLAALAPGTSTATVATFTAGLHLISLPYDYGSTALSSIFGYSGVSVAVWKSTLTQYALTPTVPADRIRLGYGYWVRFPKTITVSATGTAAPTATPFVIGLSAGWSQIGDPFPYSISISRLQFAANGNTYSFAEAVSSGLIVPTLYSYDQAAGGYTALGSGGSLQPGQGDWIYAYQPVVLEVPPGG